MDRCVVQPPVCSAEPGLLIWEPAPTPSWFPAVSSDHMVMIYGSTPSFPCSARWSPQAQSCNPLANTLTLGTGLKSLLPCQTHGHFWDVLHLTSLSWGRAA